ncbi:MAG: glycosyltransferase family 2 protein, partial [Blastocatellia bacterium]|nr:glycosyltransferase family 2 protein [Blastocatellia bacterium]
MPTLYVYAKFETIFRMKISASIIVFNEEENIAELCETISWCDEIVIVDSSSTDKTVEIAQKYTDKIFQRDFKGYKDKHEFADSKTTGDWIFWIDADERVTPELRESIENLKKSSKADLPDGFWIARKTWYLGRWIKHSGWYPDWKLRLYNRNKGVWKDLLVHETVQMAKDAKIEKIHQDILHYSVKDATHHHQMIGERYAPLSAEEMFKNGRTTS